MAKRILKAVGAAAITIVVLAIAYVAYVFGSSYRVEDNQVLEVSVSPDVHVDQIAKPKTDTPYKILSFNIGFGANSDDFSFFMDGGTEGRAKNRQAVLDNTEAIAQTVAQQDASIVLFQEVDLDGTRSHHVNQLEMLDQDLPDYPFRVFAQNYDSPYLLVPPAQPHGKNKSGLYTMSKFDIRSALRRSLPVEDGIKSIVDLDRCYSVSRIPVEGGAELILYNLHLSAYSSDGTIANDQLRMLFADMQSEHAAGNWTIAGGDFNKDLLGNSGEIFGISGDEYTWAQPLPDGIVPEDMQLVAPFDEEALVASCRNLDRPYDESIFRVTVDGFVVSDNVNVLASSVVDAHYKNSDHNPVTMTFELQ